MPPEPVAGAVAVAFDDAAAGSLTRALHAAADALEALARGTVERATAARRDWAGISRSWFDAEHDAVVAELRGSARACRDAAAEVHRAARHAWDLQEQRNEEARRDLARRLEHQAAVAAWLAATAPTAYPVAPTVVGGAS